MTCSTSLPTQTFLMRWWRNIINSNVPARNRVLGIDPGIAAMGYGIIEDCDCQPALIDYGCIITSPKQSSPGRLHTLYWALINIIENHRPSVVAIELFIARNLRTALSVGQARGIAILAAANSSLDVYEYTPLQVKQRVCGFGHGGKEQIQEMVKIQLGLQHIPQPDDAADALAVAICHLGETRLSRIISENK